MNKETNLLTCNKVKVDCVFICEHSFDAKDEIKYYCLNLASDFECGNCFNYVSNQIVPEIISEIENYESILSSIKQKKTAELE